MRTVLVLAALVVAGCGSVAPAPASDDSALTGAELRVRDVSGSWANGCAVTSAGAATCWGENHDGQLGTGGSDDSALPLPVPGLESGVAQVAAGGASACARTSAGAVWCWGLNTNKQLGIGSGVLQQRVPARVVGLDGGVASIALAADHGCAIVGAALRCWGANEVGQLGNGGSIASGVPIEVPGLRNVASVSTASAHTCALLATGAVTCWGNNERGQIGDGSTQDRRRPVTVTLGARAIAASAGHEHSCAVVDGGGVKCWGRGDMGQLGSGAVGDASRPVAVRGLDAPAVAVAAGGYHSCALTRNGEVACWGLALTGQVGHGIEIQRETTAQKVVGLPARATKIALGLYHSCAIVEGDELWCWGLNGYAGALGVATSTFSTSTPVRVR
ncbi:MAG: hypothetical protein KIT84_03060 [Labilithrix sp.]|nr:hypothetical protein [Labilithrix sp.]MCW5809962.1 hypothetical protein [Labilithrix sp.]